MTTVPATKDVLRRVPGWLWHALIVEVAMYRNLLRWMSWRPAIPAGSVPLGYAQAVTAVMSLWIFASAAELPWCTCSSPGTARVSGCATAR